MVRFVCAVVILGSVPVASAVDFVRLLAEGDAVPGTSATFSSVGAPTYDGSRVLFRGVRNDLVLGLYAWTPSGVTTIADQTTAKPGATGATFADFGFISTDGANVAFMNQFSGVYASTSGGLIRVADNTTTVPGTASNFTSFDVAVAARDAATPTILFEASASTPANTGLYAYRSTGLVKLVDRTTPLPGAAGTFNQLSLSGAAGDRYLFTGLASGSTVNGLYSGTIGGGITKVIDTDSPLITGLGHSVFDGDDVIFVGLAADGETIYRSTSGGLQVLVSPTTETPGVPGGTISKPTTLSADNGDLVFGAQLDPVEGSSYAALFAHIDGQVQTLLKVGDTFDGRQIRRMLINEESLHDRQVMVSINFTNDDFGLYQIAVPEPSGVACLFVGATILLRRRRSTRH